MNLTETPPDNTLPFTPSFLDRFMDFVQRLPMPYWLTYLMLFIVQCMVLHVLAWMDGWIPAYTFEPILLLFPFWLWGPLALMTYLDQVSLEALSSFRPLLDVDEERLKRMKYEFTNLPSQGVLLSAVFWIIVYLLLTYLTYDAFYVAYGLGTFFAVVIFVEGLISYSIGSAIYYHSFRQLKLVNLTVKMVKQFNLFRLDPIYAFSRVTSQIGVSWMIMLTVTLLTFPIQSAHGPVLGVLILQVVLALAAFALPLWFVHRRLVSEKLRLLAEIHRRVESTSDRLHRALEMSEMVEAVQFSNALNGLNIERNVLISLPTWPWRPGTLTGFLSAIVLPIILFIIQFFIRNWLGG